MAKRSRIKAAAFRVTAAVLGLTLVLAAVEASLRLVGYDPLGRITRGRHLFLRPSENPDLRYELVPGARGVAWQNEISINAQGFRDDEYDIEKPPGVRRIAVIGDSITFAGFLDADRRFTELLEARLQADGRRVEVLNLGVGGYDTLDEVAFLEQAGLAFDPDLVVVAYCINDLGVHSANLRTVRLVGKYGWWVRRVRLVQLVAVRLDRAMLGREFESINRDDVFRRAYEERIEPVEDDPGVRRAVREIESLLAADGKPPAPAYLGWYTSYAKIGRLRHAFERLGRSAEERRFEVLVLVIPYLDEGAHADAFERAYGLVAEEAARAGFGVLSVHEPFRSYGLSRLKHTDPLHPDEAGHRIIASELYEALRARWD